MSTSKSIALAWIAVALAGCAGNLRVIEHPSPNQDDRVRFLVLHYTDGSFQRSLHHLTNPGAAAPVSAHYLLTAPGAPASEPQVYRLVDENQRAWHAGVSHWQGRNALNDTSIGIEIVYEPICSPGSAPGRPAAPGAEGTDCAYPEYPPAQIETLIRLARDVLSRHPQIDPTGVVGHSDIAANRKVDPGPRFPWQRLHEAGIGAWYDAADVARFVGRLEAMPLSLSLLQEALRAYGYDLAVSGVLDAPTRDALFAFQTHFRPDQRGAEPDVQITAIALALLARYRPAALAAIAEKYAVTRDARQASP
jgi:N-acetyl-anhydromuramyl-L-alanine amidase AmpD